MNLSAPFIERPVMTVLVMIAACVLGVMSYLALPVSNLPDVNYPTINVTASFPGANPETMANNVAVPLEKEFMTIQGVTSVTSQNTLGNTNIVLQFNLKKSMDSAAQDVEAAISRAKSNLPPTLPQDPTYKKVNPSDTPIIYIALTSETESRGQLYAWANNFIGQRISMINGVAQAFVYGSPFAIRVQVEPGRIAYMGLTLADIATAINSGNPSLPTGRLDGILQSHNILVDGQMFKGAAFDELIVRTKNGAPVRIKDIGKAEDSLKDDRLSLKFIDKDRVQNAVVIAVQRQPDANTIQVAEAIRAFLPNVLKELPGSVQLEVVFDRSTPIEESVSDVKYTLFISFVLVVVVIFFYLGSLRDTFIPSIVMPISVLLTFPVMYLFNFTIDNLSLLALTLAVGFIVDDAIVVLENIVRHVENGESPWVAALNGSKQISFTILSMTISLIAVFVPILFMGGIIGKIFQEFSITLAIVTLASGIISLTLTPMLCSKLIPEKAQQKDSAAIRISKKINEVTLGWYQKALTWVLARKQVALGAAAVSMLVTILLFKVLPTDFIPDDDIGFIIGFTQSQQGTSSDYMKFYQQELINTLQDDPNIQTIISLGAYPQYREGIMFIRLKQHRERKPIGEVIQEINVKLGAIPGANTYLKSVPLIELNVGTSNKATYQFSLQGLNKETLFESGDKLLARMRADPMFQAVSTDLEVKTPQLNIEILRDQASTYGVDARQIEEAFQLAYAGGRISRILTPVDQYDVILELLRDEQRKVESLEQMYIRNLNSGELVPLSSVAKWSEGLGPGSINHISQFPAVTISFNVTPGVPLGTALNHLKAIASEVLSPDVTGFTQGAANSFEESIKDSSILLLFSVFAIYIVLGILYESYIHPLTILSTLPPAIVGGLLTLYVFHLPLSLYAYLGIILLIGIVKKNGIMMVDYAIHNEKELGESPEIAIYNACMVRFRPIMMTTFAAIVGAIPIALALGPGAEARRPLGLVIIGGLMFSQMITLLITPVIYLYMDQWSNRKG